MARGVHGTGRPQMIREFLARNSNEAFTAREIATAIDPEGSVDLVSATLSTMASTGKIARLGAGKGRVHYFWPRGMPKPDKRRERANARTGARPAPKAARTKARAPRATPAPRSAAQIAKAISAMATVKAGPSRPVRRIESNFPAPLATVDHSFDPRRAASARLAADIAEFQRRGGRIEQLGVTRLFHHPDDCED